MLRFKTGRTPSGTAARIFAGLIFIIFAGGLTKRALPEMFASRPAKDAGIPGAARIEVILPATGVAPCSLNVFSTPLAWFDGAVYTVSVEEPSGPDNGIDLRTFVWKGVRQKSGKWLWTKKLIENRTLHDRYHTGPSIGIDRYGYIHVAYNMHNMPWQYAVSKRPGDISSFEFRGERLNMEELELVEWKNLTPFARFGTSAIPGTQITYPAFFNDRYENLYVTYRFATHPGLKWKKRGFAGAIARYDPDKRSWRALGGRVSVSSGQALLPEGLESSDIAAFAYRDGWSVYLLRLFFDVENHMHISWLWRKGGAGKDCSDPCYLCSKDSGRTYIGADATEWLPPMHPGQAGVAQGAVAGKKFYAPAQVTADAVGRPLMLLNPMGLPRILVRPDKEGIWAVAENSPRGASAIYIDDAGTKWAFATGITVFRKNVQTGFKWQTVYSEPSGRFGYPKILPMPRKKRILVYAQSLDGSQIKIFSIRTGY